MGIPIISVVMPVFNSALYLKKAIDSILSQTFVEFELLLINDCSTDSSAFIISSYTDRRIKFFHNDENLGVVGTSNKGIQLATGKYICIMHSDDIAAPDRLAKQKDWLDTYPETGVVASYISFINEQDQINGEWKDDIEARTPRQIKRRMAWRNCLAHPSIMARADILKKYPYRFNQQSQEDYDVWLRMLSDNVTISKVPEKLLLYRVHAASITGTILRKANPFFKQFDCKKKFLHLQLSGSKFRSYEMLVLLSCVYDGMMGIGKEIKKKILGK